MMLTNFSGHQEANRIFHIVSLRMMSKALSRSMKLICTLVFHLVHCSMMFRSLEMWLMHPTPGLNPACSFLRVTSMALLSLVWMISLKILLCSASSVTPRHFVYCALSPFIGSLTISPLYQSLGMVSAFQMLWNRSYTRLSWIGCWFLVPLLWRYPFRPSALLFFWFLIALRISFFVGGEQSMSKFSPKGCDIQVCIAESGLLKTSLNYPAHLCSSSSLYGNCCSILIFYCIAALPGIFQSGPLSCSTACFAPS